jgi:hypothetical protein
MAEHFLHTKAAGQKSKTDGTRIPVKLHRRVCLVLTEDAVLAEEVLARKKLAQDLAGRLTDCVLLVRPGRVDAVVEELQKMGHTPRLTTA